MVSENHLSPFRHSVAFSLGRKNNQPQTTRKSQESHGKSQKISSNQSNHWVSLSPELFFLSFWSFTAVVCLCEGGCVPSPVWWCLGCLPAGPVPVSFTLAGPGFSHTTLPSTFIHDQNFSALSRAHAKTFCSQSSSSPG